MTRYYQLTEESVKKLSKLLDNARYQPPKLRRTDDGAISYAEPLRIFRTPAGGIPAAVGSTWGSALCTEHDEAGIAIGSETVRNHRTSIIPGNVFILATRVNSFLFVVEGNCPTSGGIIEEP